MVGNSYFVDPHPADSDVLIEILVVKGRRCIKGRQFLEKLCFYVEKIAKRYFAETGQASKKLVCKKSAKLLIKRGFESVGLSSTKEKKIAPLPTNLL